jgi:hypothetical protein
MPPDEVVRRLQPPITVDAQLEQLMFRGCPQEDEHGVRVFEAVTSMDLPTSIVVDLPLLWREPYAECGYAPLEAWFERTLDRLIGLRDGPAVRTFIERMPPDISPHMREALWQASTTLYDEGESRDVVAISAVRSSDPAERVALTIAALRDRPISGTFISGEIATLVWEHQELLLHVLAESAATMPDQRLRVVLGLLSDYVGTGRIPQDSPGLAVLRANLRGRRGFSLE